MAERYPPEIVEELLERLTHGESLQAICKDPRMPNRRTVQHWQRDDQELSDRILEAREIGFHDLADQALRDAVNAEDPIKGRLALDARRWYLGKLSNAFADKPVAFGVQLNVGAGDDAFAAIAGALDRAAAAVAGGSSSTRVVDLPSPSGPADAARRLADLDGDGGEGLGQDPDRS